ncbi:hypothetical protein D3C87_1561040 [compost metagenome]
MFERLRLSWTRPATCTVAFITLEPLVGVSMLTVGGRVSRMTFEALVVVLPALSVATRVTGLSPSSSCTLCEKVPEKTGTSWVHSFTFKSTLSITIWLSFTRPVKVTLAWLVR